ELVDAAPRLADGLDERRAGVAAAARDLEDRADGDVAGLFAARVAAHAVAKDEEMTDRRLGVGAGVFVDALGGVEARIGRLSVLDLEPADDRSYHAPSLTRIARRIRWGRTARA